MNIFEEFKDIKYRPSKKEFIDYLRASVYLKNEIICDNCSKVMSFVKYRRNIQECAHICNISNAFHIRNHEYQEKFIFC